MELNVKVGMTAEKKEQVTDKNTAKAYGSGGVSVYATPAMIGLMEGACLMAVDPALPQGMATVGSHLDVSHLAATPVGMEVKATGRLTAMEGKKLIFAVEAYDEEKKIGEGTHVRYVVDLERFLAKAAGKK